MLSFAELRRREFARLDVQRIAYLDYTGAALYGASQMRAHLALLEGGVFGNPHSDSAPSRASTEVIDRARTRVLRCFDVDESTHDVVFTANASAAIKLVAESYPFGPDHSLIVSADNHNSVLGIREYARRAGARVHVLPLDGELRLESGGTLEFLGVPRSPSGPSGASPEELRGTPRNSEEPCVRPPATTGLLAFPAQSNFSGVRHPLSLVEAAHARGLDVLLDVAAFIPSNALSLRDCPADFAALSFYKLFGYPTGLGALVARREALSRLRRPWFAGGTVLYASVAADRHRLRARHEGFEDGTPDFLGIAALEAGFALLDEVGMPRISAHVARLTRSFLEGVTSMPHVRVYGPRDLTDRGGTVVFNVRGVPFAVVERRAREAGVSLRGGCFCNPGASEAAFGLRTRVASCLAQIDGDFSVDRFSTCAGTPVGAVRASFGMATSEDDVHRALAVVSALSTRASTSAA